MRCEAPDCSNDRTGTRPFCHSHNERLRRTGSLGLEMPVRTREQMPKFCTLEDCQLPVYGGGLCNKHYSKAYNQGFRVNGVVAQCSVDDCSKPVRSRGWCGSHYNKWRNHGTPTPAPKPAPKHTKKERGGYISVKAPEGHPMANSKGYILEHRLVMSEHIGRPLLKHENVHHINGVRDDNRLENLELWNTYQPAGQRVEDKVAWALEILQLYSPESLNTD